MSKRQIIMVLGVWVMILFVLGLPGTIKEILAVLTGALIVAVASRIKSDAPSKPSSGMPYVESRRPANVAKEPSSPVESVVTPPVTNPQDKISS